MALRFWTCPAWVEMLLLVLSRTLTPERALSWWTHLHIGLSSKALAYLLPEGWTPAYT